MEDLDAEPAVTVRLSLATFIGSIRKFVDLVIPWVSNCSTVIIDRTLVERSYIALIL